mmetsp:Transcript_9578/g.24667  ORF Transcript_9578/g.24667 Transcript_9578/m.24667 type:complete len:122 (+) Transcript_9578:496-861(+)
MLRWSPVRCKSTRAVRICSRTRIKETASHSLSDQRNHWQSMAGSAVHLKSFADAEAGLQLLAPWAHRCSASFTACGSLKTWTDLRALRFVVEALVLLTSENIDPKFAQGGVVVELECDIGR